MFKLYYSARDVPIQGLYSALDAGLGLPGVLKEAENMVWADDGLLKSVLGTTEFANATGLAAGTAIGLTRAPIKWGQYEVKLCAVIPTAASTTVRIYYRKYDTVADTWDASWTECTAGSGQFGDTRGSVPSYASVTFEPISDADGIVGCLVQFGVRNENVLLVNFGVSFTAIPVLAIQPPDFAEAAVAEAQMSEWFDVKAGTMKTSWSTNGIANTHYNTGGTFDVSGDGELNLATLGGNGREWRLITGTGATYGPAVDDFGWHQLNAGVTFAGGRQMVLLYSSSSSEAYFNNFEIALTRQVESGTTDGSATNKLIQSGQNFLTTVSIGDLVLNVTDNARALVTAVDSDTQLTLDADIAPTGKAYVIVYKVVVHDPIATVPINERSEIDVESTAAVKMAVFPIPQDKVLTGMDGLMWTVKDAANIPDNATFRIMWVACGGVVPGEAQYAISYYSTFSKTDSPGVLLRDVIASENSSTLVGVNTDRNPGPEFFVSVRVGVAGGSVPPEFFMPIDRQVYYQYRVPVFAPVSETVNGVSAASSGWANRCSIYRKDPGEGVFSHVTDVTVASYSASWLTDNTLFGGTDKWKKKAYHDDVAGIGDKNFKRKVPDAFVEPVPVGQAMLSSEKRLWVGSFRGAGSASTAIMDEVKASEVGQPFRFRTIPRTDVDGLPDADSGFAVPISGQSVRAFYGASASLVGSPGVYVVTDSFMVRLIGPTARDIASIGCIAPGTVCEKDGEVFLVDDENIVRYIAGIAEEISKTSVQDSLDACPAARRQFMSAIAHRDHLYLALADADNSNNYRVLYRYLGDSLKPAQWENYGRLPTAKGAQYFSNWNVDGRSDVLYFGADLKLYRLNEGSDFAGSDIVCAFRFADFRPQDSANLIKVERIGVEADASNTVVLTHTRTNRKDTADTSAGTASLAGSTARVRKVDYESGAMPGVESNQVSVRTTFTKEAADGRVVIYQLAAELSETKQGDGAWTA